MTRLHSIEAEIAKLLQEHADVIQKKDLTTVQITLRLYPKGGLVRKSHFHTESERDCDGKWEREPWERTGRTAVADGSPRFT